MQLYAIMTNLSSSFMVYQQSPFPNMSTFVYIFHQINTCNFWGLRDILAL